MFLPCGRKLGIQARVRVRFLSFVERCRLIVFVFMVGGMEWSTRDFYVTKDDPVPELLSCALTRGRGHCYSH